MEHKPERRKPMYFQISAVQLSKTVCGLPVFATLFCVVWSVIFDFKASTATHCKVPNFLPSISSAIGGFTPQRYVWRICIALHCAPRFMVALSYYEYHTCVHVGKNNQLYKSLAALCTLLHIGENAALVGLTYISSLENHDLHENLFIIFMVCSLIYMCLLCFVFSWGRTHNGRNMTKIEQKSLRYKVWLFLFNLFIFLFAVYLFFRHNVYCEPGVYTGFAACEYLTVLSNIAFHGTAVIDFEEYTLVLAHKKVVAQALQKWP